MESGGGGLQRNEGVPESEHFCRLDQCVLMLLGDRAIVGEPEAGNATGRQALVRQHAGGMSRLERKALCRSSGGSRETQTPKHLARTQSQKR